MDSHPPCFTLSSLFENSFRSYADELAICDVNGSSYTYAELEKAVKDLQELLRQQGISSGDKVALLGASSSHWVVSYLAITTMSAVAVPILPDFTREAIGNIVEHAECRIVICADKFKVLFPKKYNAQLDGLISLESLALEWQNDDVPAPGVTNEPREEDLAAIIYTSGTTGSSKGVMLTHKNIAHNAWAGTEIISTGPGDRMLSVLPLAHTFECTLGMVLPLMNGASVHYLDKRPTAAVLLPALEQVRPTLMLTVPLIIEKIFKLRILPKINESAVTRFLYKLRPTRKLIHKKAGKKLYQMFGGKLRFFGVGGAPLAPDVEKFLKDSHFPYAIGYGLTETSPLAAGSHPRDTRLRAIGPAAPDIQIKIEEREGSSNGEVLIKGPNVMKGYYKDPENTAAVLSEDGWLKTGDLGYFSEDGYLYVKGRLKNMLLGPSGENIYPEEIEAVLGRFEAVLESVVTQRVDSLVARVHVNREVLEEKYNQLKDREKQFEAYVQEQLEDIRKSVNKRVASFARIHEIIEELEPFEKTPTNKIKRYLYCLATQG
ncbi:MAG: AMP-binding protein [Puniceicoccaceae bacterium]